MRLGRGRRRGGSGGKRRRSNTEDFDMRRSWDLFYLFERLDL